MDPEAIVSGLTSVDVKAQASQWTPSHRAERLTVLVLS